MFFCLHILRICVRLTCVSVSINMAGQHFCSQRLRSVNIFSSNVCLYTLLLKKKWVLHLKKEIVWKPPLTEKSFAVPFHQGKRKGRRTAYLISLTKLISIVNQEIYWIMAINWLKSLLNYMNSIFKTVYKTYSMLDNVFFIFIFNLKIEKNSATVDDFRTMSETRRKRESTFCHVARGSWIPIMLYEISSKDTWVGSAPLAFSSFWSIMCANGILKNASVYYHKQIIK